ncbi:MAG TPA: metallophosphoesterase [Polyangiaceae bacterium]|nr:metallophosphoesterase [Polyangiaceae bacterium]
MGRTVIIGDVHGCSRELSTLLRRLSFSPKRDRLVLVGDVVARGPDSRGTLALLETLGACVARGNHEERLLLGRRGRIRLGSEHRRVADSLSADEWRALRATPYWLDLPEHGVRVVHAGVLPWLDVRRTPRRALLQMRTIDAFGTWSDKRDAGAPWATGYAGPPHVIFGHDARPEPRLYPWATGIDTGCVYGGRLTAVVLDRGEKMPRGRAAAEKLVSVKAREKYS